MKGRAPNVVRTLNEVSAGMSLQRAIIQNLLTTQLSLADLQAAGQVSLPTLRRAVQELTDAQWIRVVGQAQANGGRPAMLFGLDDRHFMQVGAHIQLPGMRLITTDLSGRTVLDEQKLFENEIPAPHHSMETIAEYVAAMRGQFPDRCLLGVGIAAPGFIDAVTGDIISIGRVPSWGNFPICRRLEAALRLPVRIANDVDCMAFAEFQQVGWPSDNTLAYVGFDEGVKVSLFFQGDLYKGATGNAGLIGSHLLRVDGLPQGVDAQSLLTVEGVNRIFETRLADLHTAARSAYGEIAVETNPRKRFRLILSNAGPSLPLCAAIVDDLIAALAVAVANVMIVVQPETTVIGGLLSYLPDELFTELETAIRRHLPALIGNNVMIHPVEFVSHNSAAIGATHHFLQDYLRDPANELA